LPPRRDRSEDRLAPWLANLAWVGEVLHWPVLEFGLTRSSNEPVLSDRLELEWPLLLGRLQWWRRGRRGAPGLHGIRHHQHAIEERGVRDRCCPWRREVAAHGSQEDVERLLLGYVGEFDRHGTAAYPVGIDDRDLSDPGPLREYLSHCDIARDNRDQAIMHRDAYVGASGGRPCQVKSGGEGDGGEVLHIDSPFTAQVTM
jgi:hypothetical protein